MKKPRVAVCFSQVPFMRGGAELHVEGLCRALRGRGWAVEQIQLPFKWYPPQAILPHALAWRLIDLSESNGEPIDLLLATRFPSYLARHPNKVVWLLHQHRQAYDLYGTAYCELDWNPEVREVRRQIVEMDNAALGEARRLFANSKTVAARLKRYNGFESQPLYHPPPLAGRLYCSVYGDYVLSVGRLDRLKRHDLLLRALALAPQGLRAIIAGSGPQEVPLRCLAEKLGLASRVTFAGQVEEEALLALYAAARCVYYAPVDEDLGYVTMEAFLAQKPVVSCPDSGGVLEFLQPGENGLLAEAEPEALAQALARCLADVSLCRRLGEAGRERVQPITWDAAVEYLTAGHG